MKKGFMNILLALLFIVIGLILVLQNFGVVDNALEFSWMAILSALLVIIGLKLWVDAIIGKGGSWIVGSFLSIFGALVLLGKMDMIAFQLTDILKLWPLLFIYIGLGMFLGKKRKHKVEISYENGEELLEDEKAPESKPHNSKKQAFVVGDQKYNSENWKVEPLDIKNAVGDYHFDFTKAFIPDRDTPITIKGWAGDIKMIMPEYLEFRVEASMMAGEINILDQTAEGINRKLTFETENYAHTSRRLTIKLDVKAGDIRINRV